MTSDPAIPDVGPLLRDLAPKVLGALVRRCGDFADAEDAVQEASLAAISAWRQHGVPSNPGGWLYRVASRRLADHRVGETARQRRERAAAAASEADDGASGSTDLEDEGAMDRDDTLILLFTCCHPALTPASAIALTLRAVGGLTTAEIAHAFMVPEATLAQRISRARSSVQASGLPFELPDHPERAERLDAVLQILYLIFNEGYTSTAGSKLVRVEVSAEAIRLTRALYRALPQEREVAGLLALMLLTDARRPARTGSRGALIPLPEQDRTRWDRAAIDEGVSLLESTLGRGPVGSYQVQAAIAALHDQAARAEETDWPQILALYSVLMGLSDNPMVALNHAIAAAMVHGPIHGLSLLDAMSIDARIADHHRLHAARAHLLEMAGDAPAAIVAYRLAAGRTANLPEQHYLMTKASALTNG